MGGATAILSTRQPDQDLCYQVAGGMQEGCDLQRLGKLAAGDVVLIVGTYGRPGMNALPRGERLIVDGHEATLSRTGQVCAATMGGDDEITLTISRLPNGGSIDLSACGLKSPGLEKAMRRLAASTRVTPLYNINQGSYRQAAIPLSLQGRLNATVRTFIFGTMPVGAFIGGVLGAFIGLVPTIYVGGAVSMLAVVWILAGPFRIQGQPAIEGPLESLAAEAGAADDAT
jgi:hypothetical protein